MIPILFDILEVRAFNLPSIFRRGASGDTQACLYRVCNYPISTERYDMEQQACNVPGACHCIGVSSVKPEEPCTSLAALQSKASTGSLQSIEARLSDSELKCW